VTSEAGALVGLHVLVVEDEFMVGAALESMLQDLGCTVVGPVPRLAPALRIAEGEPLDGAVLDLNLAGEEAYPVAEALAARGVPFLFVTGYGHRSVREDFRSVPRLDKPISAAELAAVMRRMFRKT
jgi:DNA-binding response OmpR family regulator